MSEPLATWIDGVESAQLPADDRGLQYGDGLFETMLVRSGRVRFLEAHLTRLALGCVRLGLPRVDAETLRAEFSAALTGAPPVAVLKLIVTRGSLARRGYAVRGAIFPRRVLSLFAAPAMPANWRAGVDLRVATLRLAAQPLLAGIKHLNRLENVLAASEPGGEASFESLLLDAAGQVVCGTGSNVFIVNAGRATTPRVERCGVAGIMRGIVMRESSKLGVACAQADLPLADLYAADEVFITNARLGVVPVRRVGEHSCPMNGIALRLADHIEALDA